MLRRDWILFRRGVAAALILALFLGLASGLAAYTVMHSAGEGSAPIQVAVVDEEGGIISRMAVNLVSTQGFIASLMDMKQTKRSSAMAGLEEGRYQAVIILPAGYIDQVRFGNPGEGQIILSRAAASAADVAASLARFGELLLAAGQYGVFAGEKILVERGLSPEFHQSFLDRSNDQLFDQAFSLYEEGILRETAPYNGTGVSTQAYYAGAWLSFFLLLCGLFFSALYTEDVRKSMLTRLYSLSVTPSDFLRGKILYPLLFRLPILILLLAGLGLVFPLHLSFLSVLTALFALLIASAGISCASVALGGKKGWQGLLIGLCSVSLFLCGGLIPRSMLPGWVTQIGRFTPLGSVLSGLKPLWGGQADWLSLGTGLGLTLLLFALALRHLSQIPQKGEDE